jgi:hypothetical protein
VGGLVAIFSTGTLEDCYSLASVSGVDTTGGLIGMASSGTVRRSYGNGVVSGIFHVGGVIGRTDNSASALTISECYSEGSVTGQNNIGGFIGWMYSSGKVDSENHIITNCYSKANATGLSSVGGFIGDIEYGSISNCYSTGTAQTETTGGGFVGIVYALRTDTKIKVEKCYSMGNVIGTKKDAWNNLNIGGFVGTVGFTQSNTNYAKLNNNYSYGNITSADNGNCVGGFIGLINVNSGITAKLELINNYSIGKPTTTGSKGGFISTISSTGTKTITYTYDFWDTTTSAYSSTAGSTTAGAIAGKITADMKIPATFSTWNATIWNIVNGEYPTLKWDFTNVWNQVAGGNHTLKWQ